MRSVLFFALPAALLACGSPESTVSPDLLGEMAFADLSETLDGIDALYFAVTEDSDDDACVDGVGSCTWCTEWEGEVTDGSFVTELLAAPCGGEREGEVPTEYTVDAGWLEGTWVAGDGEWTLSVNGERDAEVAADADPVDASWSLSSMTVTYEGERRTHVAATMAYEGDVSWTVEVASPGEQLVGMLTSDEGDACTVTGGVGEVPSVSCAR